MVVRSLVLAVSCYPLHIPPIALEGVVYSGRIGFPMLVEVALVVEERFGGVGHKFCWPDLVYGWRGHFRNTSIRFTVAAPTCSWNRWQVY